ncbi:IS66 family transposase [Chamaesiphon minutus]|uniref:Transposase IS66 family n=1 Tax=Chamaesiphon minutus (strain ATCC 27169 / PCC 6605) TaxID=1173020 RepID=K9UAN2_CHAP6|nr:transposase [Chamaesiphon minutus]AFY92172.1 Transposase IS66 family [Chamaesiphon minutus PCC 6605]
MSINSETSPTETNTIATEVEGLRRLVEEQRKLIDKLSKQLTNQKERIEQLEAELRTKKKLKGKPKLSASLLNQPEEKEIKSDKRAGSAKSSKKLNFEIDEEITIEPNSIPENAKFNGYRNYDVQELIIKRHNIRFQIAEYITVEGKTVVGELPAEYQGRHYGPGLVCYVMYQHYQCRVPQPLIYEQLREWGIDISTGQVNRLLNEEHQIFEQEQHQVLKAGLETAIYIHTDDTGARHNGKNGYCTVIGNEDFAYFHSSDSKSRENFLKILQAGEERYVLNEEAKVYLENYQLPQKQLSEISDSDEPLATTKEEWHEHLLSSGIKNIKTVRVLTEAALLGGLNIVGRSEALRIISDGAGQFNVMQHGLCWVHIERGLRKLEGDNKQERENIIEMQGLLWNYYQELKQYQQQPNREFSLSLQSKFDEIFGRCYIRHGLLNGVLNQIRNHKIELLQVLDCPEFPLHNNAAETDIREYVTRRKISGGTRSELGRKARDTFVGLKKTCRKLGISFWNYLTSRLHGDEQVLSLSDVIRAKAAAKIPAPT